MQNKLRVLWGLLVFVSVGMITWAMLGAAADSPPAEKILLVSENFNQGKIETTGAIAKEAEYVADDLGGQSFSLGKKRQRLMIPLATHFDPMAGTFEMRVRFTGDMKSAMKSSHYLFRAHTAGHKHGFFLLYGGWAKGLMFFVSDKDGRRTYLRYANMAHWRTGEWHHLAITWDMRRAGKAELALYVDYLLIERKRNLTLPIDTPAWARLAKAEKKRFPLPTQNLTIGNWGGKGLLPEANLAIDDLRIYAVPRHYLCGRSE